MKYYDEIYPLTIVADRYGGTYSGGAFVAWNRYPDEVPTEPGEDDLTCADFWSECHDIYGLGKTPTEAVRDLYKKLKNNKDCTL